LNVNGLSQFLAWEYVPGPETLFESIGKLEAGHLLEVDLDDPRCEPTQYWDVPQPSRNPGWKAEDWEEAVDSKLQECVRRQLVSDVPLGAFLSGGVDSSLVVSAMGPAKTFSIGFDDASYNELRWARRVADHLGVDHRDEMIKPDVVDLFHDLMAFLDDPIGDFSIFPTYLVSRLARQDVTVVLSGDGGDELFGGYETYVAQQRASQYEKIPPWLRRGVVEPVIRTMRPRDVKKGIINKAKRFVEGVGHPERLSHARWRLFVSSALQEALFTPEARAQITADPFLHVVERFEHSREREPLDASLYVDFKTYLCDNILVKVDRMSMATSLESRVPYLDRELVELAFRVPPELKVAHGETKVLLKRLAARHVPPECVYRPKEGFSIPIKNWLRSRFRPLMEELLDEKRLRKQGILNASVVERLKREHLAGVENHSHVLWSIMVFEAWHDRWLGTC
jgi:asparagine synthase (glutamine-hydrolysing)